jgi:hypothetical protein
MRCASARNFGLRPASPKNGNIRGASRRLSPNSALIPGNREHRDGTPNCKSPLLAGLSATMGGIFSEPPALPGWRRSADRTCLQTNSLRSGNLTGNSAHLRPTWSFLAQETAVPQPLIEQFPTQINREIISKNRDFRSSNREISLQHSLMIGWESSRRHFIRKRPFLAHLFGWAATAICSPRQICR